MKYLTQIRVKTLRGSLLWPFEFHLLKLKNPKIYLNLKNYNIVQTLMNFLNPEKSEI